MQALATKRQRWLCRATSHSCVPIDKDALDGPAPIQRFAPVAAQVGEPDRAISRFSDKSPPIPSPSLPPRTPALLRLDPMFFNPLRKNHLCFQKSLRANGPTITVVRGLRKIRDRNLQRRDMNCPVRLSRRVWLSYSCLFVSIRGKNSPVPNEPNPFSDRIHIEQLEVSTRIGVLEEERAVPSTVNHQHFLLAISANARFGR